MNRNKQIEEMAKIIAKNVYAVDEPNIDFMPNAKNASKELFNTGYRKVSDIINEFSKELIKRFNDMEYNANTPRKTVKVDELRAQVDWVLHEIAVNTIKEFTEKYVEAMK